MIVSPDPFPNNNPNVALHGILTIQKEILMIDRHKRQHLSNNGELGQTDSTCIYCQRHLLTERLADERPLMEKKGALHTRKQLREIERIVNISGKNGTVVVPRTWIGKRVRITLQDSEF